MYITFALVLAGVALLLATPIDVRVYVERDEIFRARARAVWLFGLVHFQLHPRPARARPASAKPRRRRERRRALARRIAGGLIRPDLRMRTLRFLRDVLRALRPRDVRIRARIGMDDPAETGWLWSVLGPLGALFGSDRVEIEPDFFGGCFRFQAAGRVRLIPVQLLGLTGGFLVSAPVIRALLSR